MSESSILNKIPSSFPTGTCKVLLVDDSPMMRLLITKYLKRTDAQVTEAENGKDAIIHVIKAKAAGNPFNLIIMDCEMPILSGLDAVRHLRQAGINTPIIALTGHSSNEDRTICMNAGFTDFLPKPVGVEAFFELLRKYLKLPDTVAA